MSIFNKFKKSKLGFALIEVIVALGILSVVSVPVAMSVTSSSTINYRSKTVSEASDISVSIIETMQAISLEDLLKDINGYTTDQYGEELEYTLTKDVLGKYTISKTYETTTSDGKSFTPVTKQEDLAAGVAEYLTTASIRTRNVGSVTRTYFTGKDDNKYSFVIKNVETESSNLDIVVNVEPEETFTLSSLITQMNRTDVMNYWQEEGLDKEIADKMALSNSLYRKVQIANGNNNIQLRDSDFFLNNMTREIIITVSRDPATEAVSAIVKYKYTAPRDSTYGQIVQTADEIIYKNVAYLSTDATAEYVSGLYIGYYPIMNIGGNSRDKITIVNENEISLPVYLVAMDDAGLGIDKSNYTPVLNVNELTDEITTSEARTSVYSNIENEYWIKSVSVKKSVQTEALYQKSITVKDLSSGANQQTLFTVNVYVYTHKDSSFDKNDVFTPEEKNLLTETKASFIDNSVKVDIDSDKSQGLFEVKTIATAVGQGLAYTGAKQRGVSGEGIVWSGVLEAINSGSYVAYATPDDTHMWSTGTRETRRIVWSISDSKTASVKDDLSVIYNGNSQSINTSTNGTNVDWRGTTSATSAGTYTAYVTPKTNYAWADGTTDEKKVTWKITQKTVELVWGVTSWAYDGSYHMTTCTVNPSSLCGTDTCTVTLRNNSVRKPNTPVTVTAVSLSNSNYALPTANSCKISTVSDDLAYVVTSNKTYNGTIQIGYSTATNVVLSGAYSAKDVIFTDSGKTTVGYYTFYATPTEGSYWADGSSTTKSFKWMMNQYATNELSWGQDKWQYDGLTHSTTAAPKRIFDGDVCEAILSNNSIRDVGKKTVTVTGFTNPNYKLSESVTHLIEVTLTAGATVTAHNYTYGLQETAYNSGIYVGIERKGITGANYVIVSGTASASDAGTYTVTVKPKDNYCWTGLGNSNDGTNNQLTLTWKISPLNLAEYRSFNSTYAAESRITDASGNVTGLKGKTITGVFGEHISVTGTASAAAAGTYTAYVEPAKNYAWSDGTTTKKTVSWTIYKMPVFETYLTTDEFLYDGDTKYPVYQDIVSDDLVYLKKGQTSAVDTGNYTIIISLIEPSNCQWASSGKTADYNLTWKINKRTDGFATVKGVDITFNGTSQQIAEYVASTGDVYYSTTSATAGFSTTIPSALNVGTYTVWYYAAASANYQQTAVQSVTSRINTMAITVGGDDKSYCYDGKAHDFDKKITAGNIAVGHSIEWDETTAPITVGTYTATIKCKILDALGNDVTSNYVVTNNTSKVAITLREITVTASKDSYVYDGSAHSNSISITTGSLIEGATATYGGTVSLTNVGYVEGTPTIVIKDGDGNNITSNYSITFEKGSVTITRAPIASVSSTNKVYNGSSQSGVSGSYVNWTGDVNGTNVNTYTAYATPDSNHAWSDGTYAAKTITWLITRLNTATASNVSLTYNGASQTGVTGSYVNWSGTTSGVNVGSYTAYATPDGNHAWSDGTTGQVTINWSIAKRSITITGGSTSRAWNGSALTYNTCSVTSGSLCSGHTASYTASGSITNVGSTSNVPSIVIYDASSNNVTSNYSISTANGTLTVTRATTASASAANKTYSGSSQTGVSGSYVSWSGTTSATNAGTYYAYATPDSNHAWSNGGTEQRTVTWYMYRASTASYGTYTRTYNGGGQTGVYGSYVNWSGTTSATNAGTYYAYATPDSNHAWSNGGTEQRTATWYINKASGYVSSAPSNRGVTYNGSAQTLINAGSGTGTMYYYLSGWTTGLPSATNAGSYTIYYYAAESANYTQSGQGSMTAYIYRSCTASYGTYNPTYNGSWQWGGWFSNCSYGSSYGATNAGQYYLTATPTSNYAWSNGGTEARGSYWTMNKASVTVSWSSTAQVYNGSTRYIGYSISAYSSQVSISGNAYSSAGNYTAYASGNGNVTVTSGGSCSWIIYVAHSSWGNYYTTLNSCAQSGGHSYLDCSVSEGVSFTNGNTLYLQGCTVYGYLFTYSGTVYNGYVSLSTGGSTTGGIASPVTCVSGTTTCNYVYTTCSSSGYESAGFATCGGSMSVSNSTTTNTSTCSKASNCFYAVSGNGTITTNSGTYTANASSAWTAFAHQAEGGYCTAAGGTYYVNGGGSRECQGTTALGRTATINSGCVYYMYASSSECRCCYANCSSSLNVLGGTFYSRTAYGGLAYAAFCTGSGTVNIGYSGGYSMRWYLTGYKVWVCNNNNNGGTINPNELSGSKRVDIWYYAEWSQTFPSGPFIYVATANYTGDYSSWHSN